MEGKVLSEKVVEVSVGLRSVGLEHPEISTKKKICQLLTRASIDQPKKDANATMVLIGQLERSVGRTRALIGQANKM